MSFPLQQQIESLARPLVEEVGAFIVEVAIRGERGGKVVELYIDADGAVTSGLCADVSRSLSSALDAADLVQGKYQLVVSSPGINRPIKYPRQYRKHIGRKLEVKYTKDGTPAKIEGTLMRADATMIELSMKSGSSLVLPIIDVLEAHVIAPW